MAVGVGQVFVGGLLTVEGITHRLLASYDAKTGTLLWGDKTGSGFVSDIVVAGSRVFASGNGESLLRSYNARTGRLIWEDQSGIAEHLVSPLALDVGPGFVLMAGLCWLHLSSAP